VRWKLLLLTSLVAAAVGAGGGYGLVYGLLHFSRPYPPALTLIILIELMPMVLSISASVFIYRHTARRRKLQALLALLLSLLLSQAFIYLATFLLPFFAKSQD
jgi:hypothetical protein